MRFGDAFQVADLAEDLRTTFLEQTGAHGVVEYVVDSVLGEYAGLVIGRTELASDGAPFFRQNYVAGPNFPAKNIKMRILISTARCRHTACRVAPQAQTVDPQRNNDGMPSFAINSYYRCHDDNWRSRRKGERRASVIIGLKQAAFLFLFL